MKKTRIFVLCAITATIIFFLSNPQKYMDSFSNGLIIWACSVVPALFPFFFFSKLLIELNAFDKLSRTVAPLTKKLFNAPKESGYIFLISIVSGYPVGAKLIQEYHTKGVFSSADCKKIATFTSTSGPLFIIGTVAGNFFGCPALGWVLLLCHVLSAIVTGLMFRPFFTESQRLLKKPVAEEPQKAKDILNDTVYSSVSSILSVGTFICIFYMLIDMILSTNLFQTIFSALSQDFSKNATAFLTGIFEVTRGCQEIAALGLNLNTAAVLCCCLISFGGFCVWLQSLCFLTKCGIKFRHLFAIKLVQAAVATLFTALFVLIFPF